MTLLAAATNNQGLEDVTAFLQCLFFLGGGVLVLVKLWDRFSNRKSPDALQQPIKVQKHEDLVSDEEFEEFRAEYRRGKEELMGEIVERFERLQQARSSSVAGIYQRINETSENVKSDFAGRMEVLVTTTQDLLKEQGRRLNEQGERIARLEALINSKGPRA